MAGMISNRDWEALSAYLDGELSKRELARLEDMLESSAEMRAALDDLRRTRMILRSQPSIRAPRNFTLSPRMAGVRPEKGSAFRLFPVMRLTSALATLLFVFVVLGDLFLGAGRRGVPVMMDEAMMESAPQALQVVTEEAAIAEEVVESEVIVESEMVEKSLDTAEITAGQAPSFEAPAEGEAMAPREEPMPLTGTTEPLPSVTLPDKTATPYPTEEAVIGRGTEDEPVSINEQTDIRATIIRSRFALRILEVSLALLGVITAVLAFYLRPSRNL